MSAHSQELWQLSVGNSIEQSTQKTSQIKSRQSNKQKRQSQPIKQMTLYEDLSQITHDSW